MVDCPFRESISACRRRSEFEQGVHINQQTKDLTTNKQKQRKKQTKQTKDNRTNKQDKIDEGTNNGSINYGPTDDAINKMRWHTPKKQK